MASRPPGPNSGSSTSDCLITNNISPDELSFRLSHYPDVAFITLTCTVCDSVIELKTVTEGNVHPMLEVLLCGTCRRYYDDMPPYEFPQLFCAWCARHRTLYGCNECSAKFCEACIEKNSCPACTFQEIVEFKWKCCICVSKPIWYQRALCAAAKSYADRQNSEQEASVARSNSVGNPSSRTQSTASGASVTQPVSSTSHGEALAPGLQKKYDLLQEKYDLIQEKYDLLQAKFNSLESYKNESQTCAICLLNPSIMVMYPCGHKCLCKQCSALLSSRDKLCPICRKEFRDIIQLFE